MAKQTLKHQQENGEVATRQTARAYTHVLVRKFNVQFLVASLEAEAAHRAARAEADARETFKRYSFYLTKKPGDMIPYEKNQGGYKRFADGSLAQHPMPDWLPEHAAEYMAKHGNTEAAWVADYVREAAERLATEVSRVKKYSEAWEVASWHGSARTAKPCGYSHPTTQYKVEPINNGVRA